MNDLDYITSESMIAELGRRHEALVVVGMADMDATRVMYVFQNYGGLVKCLGLVEYASTKLRRDILDVEADRLEEGEDVE